MLKNSILTKDNLVRRGWTENEYCHSCCQKGTIDHLLFHCGLARFIWQVFLCAFGLVRPPDGADDMAGTWINSFPEAQRKLVLSGGATVCWTIWKTRNDACFNKKYPDDPASVVFRICNVLNGWALLQKNPKR